VKKLFSTLRLHWHKRAQRERLVLSSGALMLVLMLGYALGWQPLLSQRADLRVQVSALEEDWVWLQAAADYIEAQPRATPAMARTVSLLGAVDRSLRESALQHVEKRIEPHGEDRVSVDFKSVEFNALLVWQVASGLYVDSATLERSAEPGLVRARLTLRFGEENAP
jgi:type II secretory pathway component PulM